MDKERTPRRVGRGIRRGEELDGTSPSTLPDTRTTSPQPCRVAGCIDEVCLDRAGHDAAERVARRRRITRIMAPRFRGTRELDRLLGLDQPPGWRECDGGHHLDRPHDFWATCSGSSRSYAELASATRRGAA